MAEKVDVLDVEIEPQMTVRDGIIHDATRGFDVDALHNRYSSCGVTMSDIQRALDSIGWFDETVDVSDVETEPRMVMHDDSIHDVTRGSDASSCSVTISDIRHALAAIGCFD